jgi:hypothetical protein
VDTPKITASHAAQNRTIGCTAAAPGKHENYYTESAICLAITTPTHCHGGRTQIFDRAFAERAFVTVRGPRR